MVQEDLVWCAADPHFQRDDPALETFNAWLRAFEASGTPNLCLMGDLFQVWIGLEHTQTPQQTALVRALGALVSAGRHVVYLLGNRDYFIEDAAEAAGVLVREVWDLQAPGAGTIRFEHGDLINTSDLGYLRWREVSRTGTVRALFRLLTPSQQVELAHRIEERLARTNLRYKAYRPEREMGIWARRLAAEGVSSVVLGHFHVDEVVEVEGVKVRFLPQFGPEGLHLRIGTDGSHHLLTFGS